MLNHALEATQKAAKYIEDWIANQEMGPVPLKALAAHCGLSPWHLQRQFKKHLGISPRQYGDALREGKLRTHLQAGDNVAAAIFDAGYGSLSRVYEKTALGMTPAHYAKGGTGQHITYTIAYSPLGMLLIAATPRGLCRVKLGGDGEALARSLETEFPRAESLRRDDSALAPYVEELQARIGGALPHRDLPLDIRATAFQQKVWSELLALRRGETVSYRELARRVGAPGASRAVGHACGANPVAIAIPCHRVVRTDGSLGGYAWGLERKAQLLDAERKPVKAR
jgi:AraC family transcriptional regulator of adaptative response/methylated-DNA-[protein]-cysteine methyltransferase